MEDRLARLEQALEELRAENVQLRQDLKELQERLIQEETDAITDEAEQTNSAIRRRLKGRLTFLILVVCVAVVPVVALTIWHTNAITSTVIGTINALVVYFIGPGAVRLLVEGLVRAIPGVLLGQTARITVDNMRKKKAR